jgi:hypothetical protein
VFGLPRVGPTRQSGGGSSLNFDADADADADTGA